ncbi:MAG TPA: hypothetical protein VK206_00540 [Anaerolineales bacterium]|nr:hypothetical protein [Anaerolineales bacterium]
MKVYECFARLFFSVKIGTDNLEKSENDTIRARGETMDKAKALETIDAAIKALTELEHAIKNNNIRLINMETQILWLELGNLREMVEKSEDKDS